MTARLFSKFPTTFAAIAVVSIATFSLGGFGGVGDVAAAQPAPDAENGRYALSPVANGLIKLDTRTGAVSSCTNSENGWACYVVPDERAALDAEIGRLRDDNEKLKAELAARAPVADNAGESLPKAVAPKAADPKATDPKAADSERRIEIPLPSDQDVDRVMSFMERAWRRLIEMAARMQRDVSGKI